MTRSVLHNLLSPMLELDSPKYQNIMIISCGNRSRMGFENIIRAFAPHTQSFRFLLSDKNNIEGMGFYALGSTLSLAE